MAGCLITLMAWPLLAIGIPSCSSMPPVGLMLFLCSGKLSLKGVELAHSGHGAASVGKNRI
jgi:hypothetical protein